MKLRLKRASIFKLNAARILSVLAVAAMTVSAMVLSAIPIRAEAASPVTLQCLVSNGNALACNGTTADGSIALNCQSPDPINLNGGVFIVVAATCSGSVGVGGVTVALTLDSHVLSVDSNSGLIAADSGSGAAALSINNGLASVTVTGNGSAVSMNLSPLTLNIGDGTSNTSINALGIVNVVQIGTQGSVGSVSVTNSSAAPIVTINGTNMTEHASLLGLLSATAACGSSITLNLNQLFPITVPVVSCNAS